MRKTSALILALAATLVMTAAAFAEAPFHIGIATLTVSQAEDTYRGAERMIQEYGGCPTTSCPRWRPRYRR